MQGQGWQSEQQAQVQYGRTQALVAEAISNDDIGNVAFGANPYRNGNSTVGHVKSRQYGNPHRANFERSPNRNEVGEFRERPTGHLAFLKSLQRSGAKVRLVTIHDDVVIGSIKDCDDTTISLRVPCATDINPDAYQNRVFFKQNLVEFAPIVEGVTFS